MDQSSETRLDKIQERLLSIAAEERELLREAKRIRCEQNHACSVTDIIYGVQIG
jgi:hypothetical protein